MMHRCCPRLLRTKGFYSHKFSTAPKSDTFYFPWSHEIVQYPINNNIFFNGWRDYAFKTFNFPSDKDLLEGAEAAFSGSVKNGIFSQFPFKSDGVSTEQTTMVVPNLSELFDKNLAALYEKSIGDSIKLKDIDVQYDLIKINERFIINQEIILGATRDNMRPENDNCTQTFFGLRLITNNTRSEIEKSGDDNGSLQLSHMNGNVMKHGDLVLRYGVLLKCTEIFCVRDTTTGVILEGSLEPMETTHKIMLENTMKYKYNSKVSFFNRFTRCVEKEDDWKIVDIDHNMQDNKFWSLESDVMDTLASFNKEENNNQHQEQVTPNKVPLYEKNEDGFTLKINLIHLIAVIFAMATVALVIQGGGGRSDDNLLVSLPPSVSGVSDTSPTTGNESDSEFH